MEDLVFGSIAGIAGKYIEYPFDTIKVRLQAQPDHLPPLYHGPIDCLRKTYTGLPSLYRGISAPLLGAALENSSLFFWERLGREALYSLHLYPRHEPLPLSALWLTGAWSGAFTSLVLTPVELVKCRIQVLGLGVSSSASRDSTLHSPVRVVREVWRTEGLRAFWKGQLGTLIRETGGCAAWFGSKETVTSIFRAWNTKSSSSSSSSLPQPEQSQSQPHNLPFEPPPLPLWQQAVAGASAGMSYNFLFYPADTIKSRMQTTGTRGFWSEGKAIWTRYGVRGLYRGCGITVARSAPSSAFIFIVFDALKGGFHMG